MLPARPEPLFPKGPERVPRLWLDTAADAVRMTKSVAGADSFEAQPLCPEGALLRHNSCAPKGHYEVAGGNAPGTVSRKWADPESVA
jgi:hypothetical protein